ncbi:hypothetical protein ACOMHN_058878 [Nucella lapillus]
MDLRHRLTNPPPPASNNNNNNNNSNMSLPMLLGVGVGRSSSNYSQEQHPVIRGLSLTASPGLLMSSSGSLSIDTSLPLLGVGLVTLLLSFCFCCYLWKLKREAQGERGYSQLKYYPRSKKMKNDMCPVCLEEFDRGEKVAVSLCRHGFHTKCLQQWLDQHNTCPMCKAVLCVTGAFSSGWTSTTPALCVKRCALCDRCLQQWLNQHNTCPMCKAQVSSTGQAGERTELITSNV